MTKGNVYKLLRLLPVALMLLSCGDGKKAQSASEETPEFEVVGKQQEEPVDTMSAPVSLSKILTGKDPVDKDDDLTGQYVDPLGGDESYLNGSDDGFDY